MPLLSSTINKLTDVQEITAALVRYVLLNPGGVTDCFEDENLSFRTLASTYESDKDSLCSALKTGFTKALQRYFPDYTVNADFTHSFYNDDPAEMRYNISFDITYIDADGNTVPGITKEVFTVESDGRITLNFGGDNGI